MRDYLSCPNCGARVMRYRNPFPTVDVIIELGGDEAAAPIVFIQRRNPPRGWALPGGFVDYGETVEQAAVREAAEETSLDVELVHLLGVYSDPARDPRQHTLSVVFVARAHGTPRAGDDAGQVTAAPPQSPPGPLCFDHQRIVDDYLNWRSANSPKRE